MKKGLIIAVVILSIALISLGVYSINTSNALYVKSASLEGIYQRSLYELTNNVNNMEVEVSKLMVSEDSVSQQKILSNLKQQTSDAENSLSLLPLNGGVLEDTTIFMNKLNGYCTSLITYKDGSLDSSDYATLNAVYNAINSIKQELNSVMDRVMQGYTISDNIYGEGEQNSFSLNFSSFKNESINYPSLIYDGPFSDSTMSRDIKGLPQNEITKEEAEQKIEQIFGGNITNLSYIDSSFGSFETYDYGVSTKDRNYYIQIAKRGGFLLSMSANASADNDEKDSTNTTESESVSKDSLNASSNADAIEVSLAFAKSLGIEDMQCVWSASSQNICYVNLAPSVDDIVLYPDLIKAKVDLKSNSVIGWEATSYAYNHTEREDLVPTLSIKEAREKVSSNLGVADERLCVIPLDYIGETLAYEFSGEYNGYQYYLYIDAYTGDQVRVLRVIQTDQGDLVM